MNKIYIDSNMENKKQPTTLIESTSTLPVISVKSLPRKHGKIVKKLFDEQLYCKKESTKQLVTILLNFDGTIFTVTGTNEQNAIQHAVSQLAEIIKGDKTVNQSTETLQSSCEEESVDNNHKTQGIIEPMQKVDKIENQMQPINIIEQNMEPQNMCPMISVKSLPKKSTKIVKKILNEKMYCIEQSTEKLVTLSLNFDGTIFTVTAINAENAIRYAVSQLLEIIKGDETVNQSTETLQSSCEEESVDNNHKPQDIIEPMQEVDKPENKMQPINIIEQNIDPRSLCPIISVKALPKKSTKILEKFLNEKMYSVEESTEELVMLSLNFDGTIYTVTGTNEENAIRYAVSHLSEIIKGDETVNQSTEALQSSCEEESVDNNHKPHDIIEPMHKVDKIENQTQPINIIEQIMEPKSMCPIISLQSSCEEESVDYNHKTEDIIEPMHKVDKIENQTQPINIIEQIMEPKSMCPIISLQSSCEEESVDYNHKTEDIIEPMHKVDKIESLKQSINSIKQKLATRGVLPVLSFDSLPRYHAEIVKKILDEELYDIEFRSHELVTVSLNFEETLFKFRGNSVKNAIGNAASKLLQLLKEEKQRKVCESTGTIQNPGEGTPVEISMKLKDISDSMNSTKNVNPTENQKQLVNSIEQSPKSMSQPLVAPKYEEVKKTPKGFIGKDMLIGKMPQMIVAEIYEKKLYTVVSTENNSNQTLITLSLNFNGEQISARGNSELNAISNAVNSWWQRKNSQQKSINISAKPTETPPLIAVSSLSKHHKEIVQQIFDHQQYCIEARTHGLVTLSLNFDGTIFKMRGDSEKNAIGNAVSQLLKVIEQQKPYESPEILQNCNGGKSVDVGNKLPDISHSKNGTKDENNLEEKQKKLISSIEESPKSISKLLVSPKHEETKKTPKGFIGKDMLIGKMPHMIVAEIYEKKLYTVASTEVKSNQTLITLSLNFDGEQISVRGNSELNAISNVVDSWWQRKRWEQKSNNISKASSKPTETPPLIAVSSLPKHHKEIVQIILEYELYCIEARTHGLVTLSLNFDGTKYTVRGNNEKNAIGHAVSQLLKVIEQEEVYKSPGILQNGYGGKSVDVGNKLPDISDSKNGNNNEKNMQEKQRRLSCFCEASSMKESPKSMSQPLVAPKYEKTKKTPKGFIGKDMLIGKMPHMIVAEIYEKNLYTVVSKENMLLTMSMNFDGETFIVRGNSELNGISNAVNLWLQRKSQGPNSINPLKQSLTSTGLPPVIVTKYLGGNQKEIRKKICEDKLYCIHKCSNKEVILSLNFNGTIVTVRGNCEKNAVGNAVSQWCHWVTRTERKENNHKPTETLQNDSTGSPCTVNNKWPDILESVNRIDNSSNVDELEVGFKELREQPSRDIVIPELMFEDMDLEQIVDEITTQNLCSKLTMKLLKSRRWMAFVSLNIDGKTYEGVGDSPRSAIENAVCKWRFASESPTISDLPLELPKSCLGFVDKIKTTFKYDSGLYVAAIVKTVDMNFDSSEIVATAVSKKSLRMVCMGKNAEKLKGPLALTPNKCLRSVFFGKNSQVEPLTQSVRVIRDSRAVVLVKRCFRKYLYNQLYLLTSEEERDKSIFCKTKNSNQMFAVKENVAFHLYLNFSPSESDQSTDVMKEKECISHADKMLLWNVLGVQGALLTPLIGPVFFESLILGCKAGKARINKIEHLLYKRALEFQNLESPYNLHKLHIVSGTVSDFDDIMLVHPHLSAAWTLGDKEPELVDPRTGLNENGIDLEIADYAFSQKYLNISKKFENCPKITSALTYAEMKLIAKEYKAAKKSFLNELHILNAKEGSKELCECRSTID